MIWELSLFLGCGLHGSSQVPGGEPFTGSHKITGQNIRFRWNWCFFFLRVQAHNPLETLRGRKNIEFGLQKI